MDWLASGGPGEGRETRRPRAGDVARADVPTCGIDARRADVAARVRAAGWSQCVVVDADGVVLGMLDGEALEGDAATAADAMREAPSTIRPHLTLEETVKSLVARRREQVLVTTSDGRLVGLLRRADAERRLSAAA
jgi:CBS domain-containing protein